VLNWLADDLFREGRWPKRIRATAIDASPRGYPALLQRKRTVNRKRVHRLWKRAR